ncbi:MAG TPA: PBPRA1643 family SWIM/SEC-C metal-binding motif protein [Terriglobales bacterium]|nr:PBPRA1643 family SWIM/SEC-C metal-binding motif protein [Terriglobales bacterium]
MKNKMSAEVRPGVFDGKKIGKLGTATNPAAVTVQTEKRFKEVAGIFQEKGWSFKVELVPDKPENIADLTRLLNPPKPIIVEKKIGRNEPCSCGSGKKYKSCCGR